MTEECHYFIDDILRINPEITGKVLEVGSREVSGGSARNHFADLKRFPSYLGIDFVEGKGVDMVMRANQLNFEDGSFDVVVSTEMLEHDNRFWESFKEMGRVMRRHGHLIITTRSWRATAPHAFPNDYWRFLDNGLKDLIEYAGLECLKTVDCEADGGVFALGRKSK